MSPSALTITSATPRLPPELIDEILRESELSNSDLAQCCLVSHQFLPSAQQSLYNKVELSLRCGSGTDSVFSRFHLCSTRKLWRTLKENPLLVKLCCAFRVDDRWIMGGDNGRGNHKIDFEKEAGYPVQVTREWLGLLKGVRNLSSATSDHDDTIFKGKRWNTLHLEPPSNVAFIPASVQTSGVKRLKLSQDAFGMTIRDLAIPSTVNTFDFSSVRNWSVAPIKHPQLRNLSINVGQANSIDLSAFPNLVYLPISVNGHFKIDSRRLSPLVHLRRLSLGLKLDIYSAGFKSSDSVKSLLSILPSSVYRLNFRGLIPFDALTSILNGNHFSITQLGLSECNHSDLWHKIKLDQLKELCQKTGIELYYLGKEDSTFSF